jgi:integrase
MLVVRGHNEGSIFHRKADSHRVATVSMPNGKRPTLSCPHAHRPSDRDCPESKANLAELLRLRDQHAPPGGHTLTLGAFLTGWLRDVRGQLAPATWRKHESIARVHLIPRLGHLRLSELSVNACRQAMDDLGHHLDGQSVRHVRSTLRRCLADALRDGLVTRNVAALAEPPRMTKAERTYLTGPQVRALIEGTRDDRLHALWTLAATTGMREAEMLALTWANVDLDAGVVRVESTLHRIDGQWKFRDPKTAKSRRDVRLPAVTVDALRDHRKRQLEEQAAFGVMGKAGMVFTTPKGQPIHGPNLSKVLHAHLARLGLPKVGVHDLRHSAATVLYAAGVPLPVIADMLGHSTIRVTADLYRHRVPELSKEAAERMQEAVG